MHLLGTGIELRDQRPTQEQKLRSRILLDTERMMGHLYRAGPSTAMVWHETNTARQPFLFRAWIAARHQEKMQWQVGQQQCSHFLVHGLVTTITRMFLSRRSNLTSISIQWPSQQKTLSWIFCLAFFLGASNNYVAARVNIYKGQYEATKTRSLEYY